MDDSLSIILKNTKPVELKKLTSSLDALSKEYELFVRKNYSSGYVDIVGKLYIRKVEDGSIIVEMINAILPLMGQKNVLMEFFDHIKSLFNFLLGKSEEVKNNYSKQEFKNAKDLTEIVSSNRGSSINITYNNSTVNHNYNVPYIEANAIQQAAEREMSKMETEPIENVQYKVMMEWANTPFKEGTIPDKAVINCISTSPKKVIFANDSDKRLITAHNERFPNINWQNLTYIVDVAVMKKGERVVVYKIINVYPDDTFFDAEDDLKPCSDKNTQE